MQTVFFAGLLCCVSGSHLRNVATVMKKELGSYEVGWINTTNGSYQAVGNLTFPESNGCVVTLGEGRQGQTVTTFFENSTWFFLAQQQCTDSTQTILIGFFTSTYGSSEARTFWKATSKSDLMSSNILWDHVCNIIVLSPSPSAVETFMVSEFDRQVRPKAKYSPKDASWQTIFNLGSMDRGNYVQDGWPKEGNCGLKCLIYSVEVSVDDTHLRRIVGRSFHTGEVLSIANDTVQAQTMTFPPGTTFPTPGQRKEDYSYGIGICNRKCAGAPQIFAYKAGGNQDPILLAVLNNRKPLSTEDMNDTIRLGVIVNTNWPREGSEVNLMVYISGSANVLLVQKDKNGTPTSAQLTKEFSMMKPIAWTQVMSVF